MGQSPSYAKRAAAAIEHPPDLDVVLTQAVVDGKGEAFRQCAVMAEMPFMDACVEEQSRLPAFVEIPSALQVLDG
jgi:hypothetical protein